MENDDEELIQIFLEEAHDLVEEINEQIRAWQSAPINYELLVPILHALHTLKGSARMLNFTALGEYVHGLEQIVQVIHAQQLNLTTSMLKELLVAMDGLNAYLEAFFRMRALPDLVLPIDQLRKLLFTLKDPVSVIETASHAAAKIEKKAPVMEKVSRSLSGIKIKVERLDSFNKLAGQINITRSHLEQHIGTMRKVIAEINKGLSSLQEQLRYVQAEADSRFKSHNECPREFEEFDVIEFENFSLFQQSTTDMENRIKQVEDLNSFAGEVVRCAESTLVEQKRAAQALEAEIIHVRMVPTDQLVGRLERIVRQVSRELGKEVRFECTRSQGEVDRKMLENLIFPLEHMVRNAIDHGIEFPQVRKAQGKPAYGIVALSISKQGNEMVIQLSDDGQGIDVEKIRQRAIEKKLWHPSGEMSLRDAIQIISLPGFSTKEEITPISGRGVGLDVAIAAINKLGGTLQVESQRNIGSQFTIRLSFTLSLNRALIFTVAKQYYAILLANLTGLTRKSYLKIQQKLNHAHGKLDYMQEDYHIAFLREILGEGTREDYQGKHLVLPIVFLKYNENRIALVVDNLIGSQEIIVKPTGIQLKFVREIAGISLLGDSQVVLILNSSYIIEAAVEQIKGGFPSKTKSTNQPAYKSKILIIDDSATVRQITSRMLQRYAFETKVAKDGMDALRIMASDLPDIVLLDIEMPRMNGFELLEQMRVDTRYKEIPVVMITSRSGNKHRIKAQKMGTTYYLNKPFKEDELVNLLKKLQKHDLNNR